MGTSFSTSNTETGYESRLLSSNGSERQSICYPDNVSTNNEESCTYSRRTQSSRENLLECAKLDDKELKTVWETFEYCCTKNKERNLFGTALWLNDTDRGTYVWETYGQIYEKVRNFASGMTKLGLKRNDNVGIYASNRTEQMVASYANFSRNARTVALYDTLGIEAVVHILEHAELEFIVCSKDKCRKLIEAKRNYSSDKTLKLQTIVQFDKDTLYNNECEKIDDDDRKMAEDCNIKLIGFSEVMKLGKENPVEPDVPSPDDLAFIMYTSGTTGLPKGVMLHHQGIVACVAATEEVLFLESSDVHISFLPLAHIFESAIQVKVILNGCSAGFFNGDIKKLSEDLHKLRPTFFCCVPRVLSKIYTKILNKVDGGSFFKRQLFYSAYSRSSNLVKTGNRSSFYDRSIQKKVSAQIGFDRLRLILTGAAPCPIYLLEFFKVVCNVPVVQGYGLTETSAGVSVGLLTDNNLGHNGPPFSCCEVMLEDIPEMNYLTSDEQPRGEILVRGMNVFRGYYKNEAETKEVLTEDGQFHTGDVGRQNPNGTLSIVDRKKNIFKLSQGEYIAPEKIENVYGRADSINQIQVYGNSYKSFLIAVVVPDTNYVVSRLKEQGIWKKDRPHYEISQSFANSFKSFIQDSSKVSPEHGDGSENTTHAYELCKQIVLENMRKFETELKGFERIRDIIIEYDLDELLQGFNVDNECLTPSFKLRRLSLKNKYLEQIKKLFSANGDPPKEGENW